MSVETYNFSDDFQDLLLACLIRKPEHFFGFGQVIQASFFNGPLAVETVTNLKGYFEKYGKYPGFSMLGNYSYQKAAKYDEQHAKKLIEYTSKLAQMDTSDWKGALDASIDFARERAVYDGLKMISAAQKEGKTKEVNAVELMTKALSVGTNFNDMGMSLFHDSDKAIDTLTRHDYGVPTGYTELDKIWRYGWAPGWLIVPLAPPKRLKTAFCINLAINMSTYGQSDVLYYACEISQELAMMRSIYNLSGYTEAEVYDKPEIYKPRVKKALSEKMYGNIWFKGFASKEATIGDIEAHAKQVIALYGLKPKAIFVDYAETVKPMTVQKGTSDWRQQADIYTQARAMGSRLGCCVIMPDRCNKETVGQKVPNMGSFQGAFEKAGIVDVAIGLCATDEEYKLHRMRYFVFLNRHGPAYIHLAGKTDLEHMRMTIDEEIEYDPEDNDNSNGHGHNHGHSKRSSQAEKDYMQTQAD
jgi:hypothetical protein